MTHDEQGGAMLLKNERQAVVNYCRKMITDGLTKGTGGNISIFNREERLVAISTSGQDYFEMTAEDVSVIDMNGQLIQGKKASTELAMHLMIYEHFPEANAVVHCHSVYATALSILRQDLPASSYLLASAGGKDVRCSEYASFGTREIGLACVSALKDRYACLLANHGLVSYGPSIDKAYSIAATVEECAQTYMIAKSVDRPVLLDDEEMEDMVEKFKGYGR